MGIGTDLCLFERMAKTGDKIEKAKADTNRAKNSINLFDKFDTKNSTGARNYSLDRQELYLGTHKKPDGTINSFDSLKKQDKFFDQYDKNKDGSLSVDEYSSMCKDPEYQKLLKSMGYDLEKDPEKDPEKGTPTKKFII